MFDLARVVIAALAKRPQRVWADRWLIADSIIDWIFTYLGAACVAYMDARYGVGVLAVGFSYFIAEKYYGNR